ncbi:glycosyltransferase [Oscillatoria sp. FACHB-1407]|uniref:glycosyltransferase n=1 Tax=Oscillatoria sp. FACHB-1407 TaxID=2692847 RepID=UPI0016834EF0|nr:glycosyltransferase [Oscillatoria sp. FACHB-1407]MBD2459659.1 glycosyltransferase [Oscillatoria sp. FACHB-1407]
MQNTSSTNVLFISPYISPTYGGTSKAILELISALGWSGATIDLITSNADVHDCLDVPLHTWVQQDAYRVCYFPCWHRNDFIVSQSLLAWLIKNVKQYDVVHTHTIFSPLISICHWICQVQSVPYVSSPHGMLEPWAMQYKTWKKKAYYSLIERSNVLRAAFIHSISSRELSNIAALCPDVTIQLMPNGINRADFSPLVSTDFFYQNYPHLQNQKIILFLGRIDPKKGLDLLASAFATVRQRISDVHLVIAGPDSIGFLETTKQYFADANCLDAVTFTGMLTGNLKYSALTAANLYVAPSYSEGFSMSVLEGMATGLPCVITTGCNFPEAAINRVAHVVDIDAHAIANALTECLLNPQEAGEMGDRARQFIFEHYTWEQSAQKLIQAYRQIIKHKPKASMVIV